MVCRSNQKGSEANDWREVGWLHSTCEAVNKVSGGGKAATMVNIAVQNRYRTQMPEICRESADGEKAVQLCAAIRPSGSQVSGTRKGVHVVIDMLLVFHKVRIFVCKEAPDSDIRFVKMIRKLVYIG